MAVDQQTLINDGITHYGGQQDAAYMVYGNNSFSFPFNPNSLQWSYTLNTAAFDTIGGRVTQIISAKIDMLDFQGEAGNRDNLIILYNNIKNVQDWQVQQWNAAELFVPSRGYHFSVWVQGLPAMGWDLTSITYPYALQLLVNEDYGNVIEKITSNAIANIIAGVGFNPTYTGTITTTTTSTAPVNKTTSAQKNPAASQAGAIQGRNPNLGSS